MKLRFEVEVKAASLMFWNDNVEISLKLTKFEIKEAFSWRSLKLKKFEADDFWSWIIWNWRTLKLKKSEVEKHKFEEI